MSNWIDAFYEAFLEAHPPRSVFTDKSPKAMMASGVNNDGYFTWRLMKGTIGADDYQKLQARFHVKYPQSFIDWHQAYFFLSGDCGLMRLPASNPVLPLRDIADQLDWYIPEQIIPQQLYPFASEGNDAGLLVFDGRLPHSANEYPVRVYDHDFDGDPEGLSEVIFSSFPKLIECMTHFFRELKTRKNFEIIPDFFQLDPAGAGSSGKTYWLEWSAMFKSNYEEFGY